MTKQAPETSPSTQHPERVLALVSGTTESTAVVRMAASLAETLDLPWEAFYVETPDTAREGPAGVRAAEALGIAARSGGTIGTITAATLASGIQDHLQSAPATHLVLEQGMTIAQNRWWHRSLLDSLSTNLNGITLHIVPSGTDPGEVGTTSDLVENREVRLREYLIATALVLITLSIAEILKFVTGTRSLDLLFLFPVIAVAARFGLRPAVLAAMLSVFSYNFFLLTPAFSFDIRAPQNLVMSAVFLVAAVYTSIVTGRMRGRLLLSDRSARENASLAALAQRLTRDADWESTARTLCEHVHGLLDLNAAVFREIEGKLAMTAGAPEEVLLGPVDWAALDWSWTKGEEAGAGTGVVSAADWQFQPLKTSLGTLAVLALAREDGRDPVRPHQRVLLSTIVAQAALAHERLMLEDRIRASTKAH